MNGEGTVGAATTALVEIIPGRGAAIDFVMGIIVVGAVIEAMAGCLVNVRRCGNGINGIVGGEIKDMGGSIGLSYELAQR